VDDTRATLVTLLQSAPGQPRKALYQHSFPISETWGYLADRDSPVLPFDDAAVYQLHADGVLEFAKDDGGRKCMVLTDAAIADTVRRPLGPSSEALRVELKARSQDNARQAAEIKQLRVGGGPTFDELAFRGKVGGGRPYRFEELLGLPSDAPVPPLVFIHVPRTAGSTINKLLMRNYKYRADSYGDEFFPRYFPTEFLSLIEQPQSPDDRIRPAFFTGHINLGSSIFRRMPVRYVAITMLREPVERIVSHYRFNSTQPSVFRDAIRKDGLDVAAYLKRFAIEQQYELFAPATSGASSDRVAEAVRNLETSISIFGLQEQFKDFTLMLEQLLGLPDVSHRPLNRLPKGAAKVTDEQIEQLRVLLRPDIEFYEAATKLYRQRLELLGDRSSPHPWSAFYA
jgi:hypothetical protein